MKISAAPFSFIESPPQAASAKGGAGYGDVFESAIRTAEKGPSSKPAPRDDHASSAAAREPIDNAASHSLKKEARAGHDADASKKDVADAEDDVSEENAAATDRSSALVLLGRLFGDAVSGKAEAAAKSDGDAAGEPSQETEEVLEERTVVVSLQPGATEESLAAQPRGKVTLEVLRMETHFEPRSDAVVLVEGKVEEAVASKAAGADADVLLAATESANDGAQVKSDAGEASLKVRLSFDEALARLGKSQAANDTAKADGGPAGNGETDVGGVSTVDGRKSEPGSADDGNGRGTSDDRAAAKLAKSNDDKASVRVASSLSARIDDERAPGGLPIASMTDQVAGRIIDTLGSASSAAARNTYRPAGESILRFTAGGATLKTLTIQLQPENLGVLDVSMRLVEGQLTLELAASEATTAKVLAEDREGLRKLLQHAGFSMDEASITIVTRGDTYADSRIDGSSASRQDGGSSTGGNPSSGSRTGQDERDARQSDGRGRQDGQGGDKARRDEQPARPSGPGRASNYI